MNTFCNRCVGIGSDLAGRWVHMLLILATGLGAGCDRQPVAAIQPRSEYRFCPPETYRVSFLKDPTFLFQADDDTFGFPLVAFLPGLLKDAGLGRERVSRFQLTQVAEHTAFVLHTPEAGSVIDRLKTRGLTTRLVEGDVLYELAQPVEDPARGAWAWVLVEPQVVAVGNVHALEEILHTARGRHEDLHESRPELHQLLRTGSGCDSATYVFIPRKGLEVLGGIQDLGSLVGMDSAFLGLFPVPQGMLMGATRGRTRALGFMVFDLGNVAFARVITKWGRVIAAATRLGIVNEFPEADRIAFDQEGGMVRFLMHFRGSVWDAELVKARERGAEWERKHEARVALMAKTRPLLAPGNRFEIMVTGATSRETAKAEVLSRDWNGNQLTLRMEAVTPTGSLVVTNYGQIVSEKAPDGSEIHVRLNTGQPNEQTLRVEGDRLVGRMPRNSATVEWRRL